MRPALEELSVSALSQALKRTIEGGFTDVSVRGEISGAKKHTSGHFYFTLKDEFATIDAVCWRPTAMRFEKMLQEGAEILCRGRVTTYPLRSKYQLVVESISLAGEGALLKLFEQRKQKLKLEGLFDLERKKALPFFPQTIGVVTSPTGAVIRDILHRLQDRLPCHVILWPVNVQGDGAANEIAGAIQGMSLWSVDLLIVARGGGSAEDLAAFNEENVVRAVAASEIPIISAVGHETDTTLIDYAADLRAPTPSAAAEMAVPVRKGLLEHLTVQETRLKGYVSRFLERFHLRLSSCENRLPQFCNVLYLAEQRFDDASSRLQRAPEPFLKNLEQHVSFLTASLKTPEWVLQRGTLCVLTAAQSLRRALVQRLERDEQRLHQSTQMLENLSYKKTLERGFCLASLRDDHLLTSAKAVSQGTPIQLHFFDGVVDTVTTS